MSPALLYSRGGLFSLKGGSPLAEIDLLFHEEPPPIEASAICCLPLLLFQPCFILQTGCKRRQMEHEFLSAWQLLPHCKILFSLSLSSLSLLSRSYSFLLSSLQASLRSILCSSANHFLNVSPTMSQLSLLPKLRKLHAQRERTVSKTFIQSWHI